MPHDVIYTDWDAAEGFVYTFLAQLARSPNTPSKGWNRAKSLAHLSEDDLNDWW